MLEHQQEYARHFNRILKAKRLDKNRAEKRKAKELNIIIPEK